MVDTPASQPSEGLDTQAIWDRAKHLGSELARRMGQDQVVRMAAALSYTSSLALVPMLAVVVSVLAGFPAFADLKETVQVFIVNNLVPDAGAAARDQLNNFVGATGGLSVFGMAGILVTAVLLLLTIETAFNRIFRVQRARPLVARLVMYWTVLTLGPLLLGMSLSLRGYFTVLQPMMDSTGLSGASVLLADVTPFMLTVVAFMLFYVMVPYRSVSLKDAAIGALTATILLQILRRSFGVFIVSSDTYGTIYGAVAVVPVFLVWMYLSWLMILIGAVVTASLPAWRRSATSLGSDDPVSVLQMSLELLDHIRSREAPGKGVPNQALMDHVMGAEAAATTALEKLSEAGYVAHTDENTWVVTRPLEQVKLYDLLVDLELPLSRDFLDHVKAQQEGQALQALTAGYSSLKTALDVPLSQLGKPAS